MSDIKTKPSSKAKSKTAEVSKEKMDVAALMELLDRKSPQPEVAPEIQSPTESASVTPPASEKDHLEQLKAIEMVEEKLKQKTAYGKKGKYSAEDELDPMPEYNYSGEFKKPGVNKAALALMLGVIIALAAFSYFISQKNIEYSDDEVAILKDKKTKEEAEEVIKKAEKEIEELKKDPEIKQVVESLKSPLKFSSEKLETKQPEAATQRSVTDKDAEKILELLRKN